MQSEIKSNGLCILTYDGEPRNRKMSNRVSTTIAKVETPEWFEELKFSEIIDTVNEIIKNKAYIEYDVRGWVNPDFRFGSYIYFINESDAVAFKLRWM